MFIIIDAIGVSSNGRTRDFGSLYHGSNPCAPTKIKQCPQGAFFILVYARIVQSVARLHGKTLSMFCTCFGKSQISQNTSGGIPTPLCAPQPQLTNCPLGQFFVWNSRAWRVRKLIFHFLSLRIHFRTAYNILKTFELATIL